MPTQHSDGELIAACINREAWAWDALVERYKRLVYSVALGAGLSQEDAADVFQTVFARLLEQLRAIRSPQGLAAWLITTTKREAWSVLRKQRREQAGGDAPAQFAAAKEWLFETQAQEDCWADRALILEALGLIGERCRRLLWLLYFDLHEPSYEDICGQMQMPVGSIGPTRARCLQKMREVLRKMGMSET